MKLYSNIKHLTYKKYVIGPLRKKLRAGLLLKEGDLVNTCTGFNNRIVEIEYETIPIRAGTGLYDILLIFSDGSQCSWLHCCDKAKTVKEIEQYFDSWPRAHLRKLADQGYMELAVGVRKQQARLKKCLPICDQDGMKH